MNRTKGNDRLYLSSSLLEILCEQKYKADTDVLQYSDDWIEPSMYQTLLELSTTYNADISSCATMRIIDGKPERRQFDGATREFNFNQMIEGLISGEYVRFEVWNKLWRRSLIGDLRFKEGQISEDVYFDFQAFSKANKLVHLNRPLHNYVVNRPGSTNTSFKIARLCIFDEFDAFICKMKEEGNDEVCNMVACIALIFSKNLYEEAVRTEQDKAIKERLYQLFKKYYKVSGAKQYRTTKGRIYWYLFNLSPSIYYSVKKLMN